MKDKAKDWIWSFLITMLLVFVFAALYWILYKNPVLYDAFLRFFGGSGTMQPPRKAMMRLAVGVIPGTLFVRILLFAMSSETDNERSKTDE